jgi:uncharacterized membrane protein
MIERYPTDRIVYFSDAIFAIAITLLILEIKIPPTEDISSIGTIAVLQRLIPSFIGFFISFLVTALYWRAHLLHAQFIKSFDSKLLWYNIWLLLFVVLLPFSTAFYSKNFNYNGPFVFYCVNLVLIGLFNYFMIVYIIRKEGYSELLTPFTAKWLRFRAIVGPLVWIFSALLVPVAPVTARFAFISIFVIHMIGERRFKKNLKPTPVTN